MDRAIRVCRSHGFVSTAKKSIIFDMAKKNTKKCPTFLYNYQKVIIFALS